MSLSLGDEDVLHGRVEVPGDGEGQRQGRQVAAVLDRVDRLPRDAERLAEVALGQSGDRPQLAHPVLHVESMLDTKGGVKHAFHRPSAQPNPWPTTAA